MVSKCRCSVSPHYCDYCGVLSVMSPPRPQCPLHTPHLYHGWWRQEAGRWYFYVNNGWLGLGRLATLQWAIICQAETKLQTDDLMDLLAPPRHTDGPRRVVSGHHRTQCSAKEMAKERTKERVRARMLPIVSSISLFPSFRPLVGADFPGAEDENGNR